MTREEAIKIIEVAIAETEWNCPMNYSRAFEKAIEALQQQPEIIRCKECKYYDKDSIDMSGFFFCEKISTQMDVDDYCSYAERKINIER